MRRYLSHVIVTALAALALAVPAHASTITDTFDPDDQLFGKQSAGICTSTNDPGVATDSISGQDGTGCFSLAFTHDISASINPPALSGASLDLYFYDSQDPGQGNPEEVKVQVDLGQSLNTFTITTNSDSGTPDVFTFDVLTLLNDGVLEVYLERGTQGQGQADFFFAKSILNAETEENQLIPEPASLMLFGGGLSMIAARVRRRTRARS
jgi:hypothetical protein